MDMSEWTTCAILCITHQGQTTNIHPDITATTWEGQTRGSALQDCHLELTERYQTSAPRKVRKIAAFMKDSPLDLLIISHS